MGEDQENTRRILADLIRHPNAGVDASTLAQRKAQWVCPEPKIKTGYAARYAKLVTSAGTTAARKAGWIVQNTLSVLAYELMTACQAIEIRRRLDTHGQGIAPVHEAILKHVREKVAFYEVDRELWPDIQEMEKMVRSGELLEIVREFIPDFH